jgi:hypothetical protein
MFHFTIRDLLWATVVAAIGLGWILDHQQCAGLREDAASFHTLLADLKNHGYEVEYGKGWMIYRR